MAGSFEPAARLSITVHSVEEKKRFLKHALYDGLDFDVARRLELEAGGSFLEALVAVGKKVIDDFSLSETEKNDFSKAIAERERARSETMQICRSTLVLDSKVSESAIKKAIGTIREEELKHEMIFTEKVEEIFDPTQVELICKKLMIARSMFARVPVVYRCLKLTVEQRSKFELARLTMYDLTNKKNDPSQVSALEKRLEVLIRDADNSLNSEQFLFVMRALDFVKEGESIRELYERESEANRLVLRTNWKAFEEVRRTIAKESK